MTDGERFVDSVRQHIKEPRLIVDVGAHTGKDAVAFKKAFPNALVLAIDPISLDEAACTAAGVVASPVACGPVWAKREFFLDENECLNSMYARGVAPKGSVMLPTVPLDVLAADADAIKIDVEGAAWDVLSGAQEALSHAKLVQIETETEAFFAGQHLEEECFSILEQAGFTKVWEERHWITATGQQTESVWVRA